MSNPAEFAIENQSAAMPPGTEVGVADEQLHAETMGMPPEAPRGAVFHCASCGHSLPLPEELIGRQAKCPRCNTLGIVERPTAHLREPDESDVRLDDLADPDSARRRSAPLVLEESLALESALRPESTQEHLRHFFSGNPARNIAAGLLGGLNEILVCMALAMLVFSSPVLAGVLPHSLYIMLCPVVLGSVLLALHGRLPVAVGAPGPATTLCALLLVSAVGADMAGRAGDLSRTATMLVALGLTGAVTGVLAVGLSRLGLAERVRFLPVEVFGGMLAGFGVLLAKAWFQALAAGVPGLAESFSLPLGEMIHALAASAPKWGPPVAFGLAFFLVRTCVRGMVWPVLLALLAIAGWNAAVSAGVPFAARMPRLPDLLDLSCYMTQFRSLGLGHIDWGVLWSRNEFFVALAAVALGPSLVRVSILEAVLGRDADARAQLAVLGGSNMLSGCLGGAPATLSLSGSLGLRSMGATGPLAGFTTGLLCLALMVKGRAVLPFVPQFVPLGILLATALSMPVSWLLRDSRNPLTRKDEQRIAWGAFFLVAVLGAVLGVFATLLLGLAVALTRSADGSGVRFVQTGDVFHSNVDRSPAQRRTLRERGGSIVVLRLHGFLFLGTLHSLLGTLRERLAAAGPDGVRYVLLDFSAVSGLGASALQGFRRLEQLAQESGFRLCLTSVPLELEGHLEAMGYQLGEGGVVRLFLNLDYALESCEDEILSATQDLEQGQDTLEELLAGTFPEPALVPTLMKCLERMEVKKKTRIISQGDESDSMFFLQSGKVQVELSLPGGRLLRLKKMGPGTVFGEMGLYTSAPRSATVIAVENSVVYRLSAERFRLIQAKAPQLAAAVNRFIVGLLAERLAEENAKTRAAQL